MSSMIQVLLLSLLPNIPTGAELHAFHLSKCLLEYNEREKAIQISMHIFLDDLEDALRLEGHDQLFICTKKEAPEAEQHMEAYLRKHFQLVVNGQEMNYNFLGKEASDDLMGAWCYIEVENIQQLQELEVKNSILMELFDDQKNVVHLVGPNQKRGVLLFQKGRDREKIAF
jgi:hypothetical protein